MMPLCGDLFMLIFENKILADAQGLFEGADRVLLAVSGGADSVAMAHMLAKLKKRGRLDCEFVIGHVNHRLRGADSDGDEAFVKALAESLAIPVVIQGVDVKAYAKEHKFSIETAGRIVRLKALAAMAADHHCNCIATAHHKDDLAETMIHRMMRGTGFRGLCGIRPVSLVYGTEFIRPMLSVRRAHIIQYCKDHSIVWRVDASNQNVDFTRNRIRHSLMPVLEGKFENLAGHLADLSQAACRFSVETEKHACDILDTAIVENQPSRIVLQKACLESCPPWVFYEVVRKVLVELDVGLRGYTQDHFKAIRAMMDQKQAEVSMPGAIQIYAQKEVLGFYDEAKALCLPSGSVTLGVDRTVQFGPWQISCQLLKRKDVDMEQFFKAKDAFVEWFDADRIQGPIHARPRQEGDKFWPIGAIGEKKVGRFLIDAQLGAEAKRQAFIIADAEKILWVALVRMSELAKMSPQSRRIFEIRLTGRRH